MNHSNLCSNTVCNRGPRGYKGEKGDIGPQGEKGSVASSCDFCEIPVTVVNPQETDNLVLCFSNPQEDECLGKLTLQDTVKYLWKLIESKGPQPTICNNSTSGYGIRYRNVDGSADQQEVYMGVGNLGNPANRVSQNYPWNGNLPGTTYYKFEWTYDTYNNSLFQLIRDYANPTNNAALVYPNASTELLTKTGLTPNELNLIQIIVANNDTNPNSSVSLIQLTLRTSIMTFNMGSFPDQQGGSVSVYRFSWPEDGSSPADGYSFFGKILITGPITGPGNESTRVEISVNKCDDVI